MKDHNESGPTISPKKDMRWRVTRSESLWVLIRNRTKDLSSLDSCGVIESIERSVYVLEGQAGEWVRYCNYYHPLHTSNEFAVLLQDAKNGRFYFFNNDCGAKEEPAVLTKIAPFIFSDEAAHAA